MVKEGSLGLSTAGIIIRYGQSLADILGYSPEEIIGRDFTALSPDGGAKELTALLDAAKSGSPAGARRTNLVCKDGRTADLFVSVNALRDTTGALTSYLVTLSTHQSTDLPAMLSDEFQRIFRFSNDAVAITDTDGGIIDVNRAFLDTYGYERHEVLGKNPRVLKSSHSGKDLYERMWGDILDPKKGFWRGEIINKAKDGREVPVLLSINAIKDPSGKVKNFLGIAFNMTTVKELEKLRQTYIDYIVHDMRNPLTSISVNAELLLTLLKGAIPEKSYKKLGLILSCAQKINQMTSDMLEFSKAKNGKVDLNFEDARLDRVLREAVEPFAGASKVLYVNGARWNGELDLPAVVRADHDKLQRIIYNLLSNAFKNAALEIRVDVELRDGLRVTVADDGKGLSIEDAGRVFGLFYQTPGGVRAGGAGLGLSIVKTFVEAHGGTVWASPGTGTGALFGFHIPV